MKRLATVVMTLLTITAWSQRGLEFGEKRTGILAAYHMTTGDNNLLVFGEEYELGGYMMDEENNLFFAASTSLYRLGIAQTYVYLPTGSMATYLSTQVKIGREIELFSTVLVPSAGIGVRRGVELGNRVDKWQFLWTGTEEWTDALTIPLAVNIMWESYYGDYNALSIKYDITGIGNFWGLGTYIMF